MLRNMFLVCLSVLFVVLGYSASAFARESSKYDRKAKKQSAEPTLLGAPAGTPSSGDAAPVKSEKPKSEKPSEKVDLSDLENRYWAPKDTEFSVVQNRLYTKAKRFSVAPTFGPLLNDAYNNSSNLGVIANYYFSERSGIEVQYFSTMRTNSDLTSAFITRNQTSPNFNKPNWYMGVGYNWVPIYAKLSLLEKKILYFDMFITAGLGVTNLTAIKYQGTGANVSFSDGASQSAPTVAIDIGQQVFLGESWALRADLRNHWYSEAVYQANSGDKERDKITYSGAAMISITYFFKSGAATNAEQNQLVPGK